MNCFDSIGGYFELELNKGREYHSNAIALNTGRNALEYILKAKQFIKIYVPYYTCDTVLEPFHKTNTKFEFYHIDEKLAPVNGLENQENSALLYTNYFGIKGNLIKDISHKTTNLIIDNSQAFFETPLPGIDTFYSCRKFFGVPDGAYLFTNRLIQDDLPTDISEDRFSHLLVRIEKGAEVGYEDFLKNESSLSGQPIKKMSKLTQTLLKSIDYNDIRKKRNENFLFLDDRLRKINELSIDLHELDGPMVYPFLLKNEKLREALIEKKIFIPTYWKNMFDWAKMNDWEYYLAKYLLPLPIDQRYSFKEMTIISDLVMDHIYG